MIIWNKQTNKAFHQVVICWSFDDNLLIIWWSSIDYMTNKQTNLIIWWSFYDHLLYDNNKAYHLLIIWWSSVIWHQTNKQINVIRWGSSNDHLTIICYKLTKNRQTNFIIWWLSDDNFMIIWWSFDDHLIIVWWYSLVNKQTNKQSVFYSHSKVPGVVFYSDKDNDCWRYICFKCEIVFPW